MVDASTMVKDCRFVEIYDNEIILKSDKTAQVVAIDRRTAQVSKRASGASSVGTTVTTFAIQAVYGIIELVGSKYLIVVSSANFVGEIFSRKIFQVKDLKYIPIDKKVAVTNAKNIPFLEDDRSYIEMLDNFFAKKFLYFSHEYDLTCTIQRACETNFEKGFFKSQYFFNEIHIGDFIKTELTDWVVPFISGLVEIRHVVLPQTEFDFILISRRDKRRSGMRFISRGCDLDGNCSNTADTEQILALYKKNSLDTKVFAHVQVRGSIPFLWKQKPNLKWEPLGDIYSSGQNIDAAQKHFQMIVKEYGNQVCINLIDKKRTQLKIGTEFQRVVEELVKNGEKHVRYVWFDFHKECAKMKYENLSRLLTLIETDSSHMGMFEADIIKGNNGALTGTVLQSQKGTFRTNCMDCLDRTNVVQSVIGRKMLHLALIHAKLSDKSVFQLKPFETLPGNLENTFREVWTNNANAISMLYTGTGALKTDFTRTGKRTRQGAFQDAKNSITRYVKGNFYDHLNQNSIDLILGKWRPKEKPYRPQKINNFFILGFIIFATPMFMKFVLDSMHAEIFEPNTHKPGNHLKGLIFYATVFGLTFAMLFKAIAGNPHKFVELPVLNH